MTGKRTASPLYSVHPSVAYARAILDNLPKTTGKPLEEWLRLVKKSGAKDENAIRDWLRAEHALGATTAWMIAERAVGKGGEGTDPQAYLRAAPGYVEAMYSGAKTGLRPLHNALVVLGRSLGKDVQVCPCETIAPFYRKHVFAQVKPSTRTRIDFGLALKGAKKKPPRRLVETGGLTKGDRITHRFPLSAAAEIDAEVKEWLRIAYDLDS